jgi:NAD(P)-dependent dehydrogenase (short-subunit alcohol dehydrogenase family)
MNERGDLFSVAGKWILVTGGGRGLGLDIARGFVDAGANVMIASRKLDRSGAAALELSKDGGTCIPLFADVRSDEGAAALTAQVVEYTDGLDVLVNNAAAVWSEPLATFRESGWDNVLATNLKGPFYLIQRLLPLLEAAARHLAPARVINIGSVEGLLPSGAAVYSYAASKAGLHQLTLVLARELGPLGITVNAIAPGPFLTDMTKGSPEANDRLAALTSLGRLGRPEDIVGASRYLASAAASWVTGQILAVDGGLSGRGI